MYLKFHSNTPGANELRSVSETGTCQLCWIWDKHIQGERKQTGCHIADNIFK